MSSLFVCELCKKDFNNRQALHKHSKTKKHKKKEVEVSNQRTNSFVIDGFRYTLVEK